MRKQHPNTVSIQLQRLADPALDEIFGIADDVRSQICDHGCHFHRVPPGSLSHHISIEAVEDDLMGQLHTLIEDHQSLSLTSASQILSLRESLILIFCSLCQMLILIPTVSECADSINIEGILPHADNVSSGLCQLNVSLFVDAL